MSTGLQEDGNPISKGPKYLHQKIELIEQFDDIPAGAIGYCLRDDEDLFSISFVEYGWLTLEGKGHRNKFKLL